MKVLYLCHQDNYHIRKWIPALRRNGLDIVVATLKPAADFDDGTPCLPLLKKAHTHYLDFFRAVPRLREIIHQEKPDLIFASYAPGYGLTAFLSRFRPFVVQTWSRDAEHTGSLASFTDHVLVKTFGRFVLRRADGLTSDGVYCGQVIHENLRIPEEKILPTPWGIDLDFFQADKADPHHTRAKFSIPDDATVLFSPRGVYWYYQPEVVLPALQKVLMDRNDVFILIPTLGHPIDENLRKVLAELQNHPRVRVLDSFQNAEQMRDLWSVSDWFLSVPVFDGVSESISEGRAMGAIPILNRIGSNLERAEPDIHALYVSTNSAESLAVGILQSLNLPREKQEQMRKANREWVTKNADVNKTCSNLIQFLQRFSNRK